ncbi:hypothetical protein [Domibacillus enclensis]|nr:hypothetical protein [Domibacillus enclensis]
MASLLYTQVYNAVMPRQPYTKQDIHYIIQLLEQTIQTGQDELQSRIVH